MEAVEGTTTAATVPEVMAAFHETYRRVGVEATELQETSTLLYALAEVMVAKGIVGIDELDRARRGVRERVEANLRDAGLTVQMAEPAPDKYEMLDATAEIDCEDRLELCGAACCRLRFALSEQDVLQGTVAWTLDQPYMNLQRPDGYCTHNDIETLGCQVYDDRPAVCRGYDCRQDQRIWLDFDNRVVNPDLQAATGTATGLATLPIVAT